MATSNFRGLLALDTLMPCSKPKSGVCKAVRQGTVVLSLVSRIGRAGDVKVVSVPLGFGLEQQSAQAIQKWKFKPAMKDGKAVPVYARIAFNFHPPMKCSAAFLNKPSK